MKLKGYLLIVLLGMICYGNNGFSQANTKLSNLVSPTAVNLNLLPGGNNTLTLGNTAMQWKSIYLGSNLYLKNVLTMQAPGTTNFFIGPAAGNAASTAVYNTGVGYNTLGLATSGGYNTAVGHTALRSNTTGSKNVALGYVTLYSNTTGSYNTGNGERSLYKNTTGSYNTSSGEASMYTNTTGNNNSAYGYRALFGNTTGSFNTGLGYQALYANTTGTYNQAGGAYALFTNTTGSYNTGEGYAALYQNTTGNYNTAVGYYAMLANSTGSSNTALGYYAMYNNSIATDNIAIGMTALENNTSGNGNVAVGSGALQNTSTGYNTAVGFTALKASTSGSSNTATGSNSLTANTTGGSNTASGFSSLVHNTTGYYNTGFGKYSLFYNSVEYYNTAIGYSAGDYYTGSNNTFLGAFSTPTAAGFTNSTAIGYASVLNASNRVVLGNASTTSVIAGSGFVIYSDGRFKKNIKDNVPGLEFIKLLKPVTYTYDTKGLDSKLRGEQVSSRKEGSDDGSADPMAAMRTAMDQKEKIVYTGLIAQDVETAAKQLEYNFSGVHQPENEHDVYGLSYSEFVMPLIKSVQELSGKNDSLQQLVFSLVDRLEKMESILKISPSSNGTLSSASLAQNAPNPFKANTVISYSLPQQGISNAQLVVYDAAGKRLRMFTLSANGRGTVNLNAAALPPGTYHYSLFVNGAVVDTKKMVLLK